MQRVFREYWSRKADSDHVRRADYDVFRIGAAEIQPFLEGARRVLDIGCGAGELFEHLQLDRSAYLGVDYSRSMLRAFAARHPGVRLAHGDAATYATSETFDFILINNVVQYCSPSMTFACLQNCADSLAEGGRIFLGNVPHRAKRVAYHRGMFTPQQPGALVSFARLVRTLWFVTLHPEDRLGFWYLPSEIARMAESLGLECEVFGCILYPCRFTAVLSRRA